MTALTKVAAVAAVFAICAASAASAQAQTPAPAPTPAAKPKSAAKPAARPAAAKKPAAATEPTAPPGAKSLCVVPAFGHKYAVQTIGLMVFGNAYEEVPIDAWGIDDVAVRKINQIIGKQLAVRKVDVPRSALDAYEGRHELFSNPYKDFLAALRNTVGPRCDFVLILTRGSSSYSSTNQTLTGLGILNHDTTLLQRLYLYGVVVFSVYDGRTFAAIRTRVPASDLFGDGILMGPSIHGMYRRVDKTWWPAPPSAAAQSEQLKTATRTMVEEAVTRAMKELFDSDGEIAENPQFERSETPVERN